MMDIRMVKSSLKNTTRSFLQTIPLLLGVLSLVSLILVVVPSSLYKAIFTGNAFIDPFIGAALGSIATGNPITSYIIGGELMDQGVGPLAVVAFIVAWVTVGLTSFPFEAIIFGKRFAAIRNGISFLFAVAIAILMHLTLGLI